MRAFRAASAGQRRNRVSGAPTLALRPPSYYIRYTMPDKPKIKALFSLPQSIKTRIEAEAYWSRRTQSAVVEQALRDALDKAEAEREAREATGT